MMKNKHTAKIVCSISILTILIIGFSIFTQWLLGRDSMKLEQSIASIERSTRAKDWKQAETSLKNADSEWSKVKGTWSALVDHQEIDNIDVTLSRLEMLIQAEEVPSALSETAALKKYIGHIPEKERLRLVNLF